MVVDTLNSLVQLFSEQGENLSQFGCKGNLDHQLDYPHGLSVDNIGNIIVADRYNESIKIFSPDGHHSCKFRDEGSFTFPSHYVQYDKYLVVSDANEHCIKVFAGNGNFLYILSIIMFRKEKTFHSNVLKCCRRATSVSAL